MTATPNIWPMYAKIVFRGKHITIHHQPVAGGRTDRFTVTTRLAELLGWIRWYGPWKQWCFLPCEGTVWSQDCLADVQQFLRAQI